MHNNNEDLDAEDRLFKIRPSVDYLNEKVEELARPLPRNLSIDEAMEPHYGHHPQQTVYSRQANSQWCMATAEGYLVKYNPYTGKNPRQPGFGLGGSVVKMLALNTVPKKAGHYVYIDNYFKSLRLLRELTVDGIKYFTALAQSDGTGWSDRAPMKDLRKAQRGTHNVLQATNGTVRPVRWKHNGEVTVASSWDDPLVLGKTTVKRWARVYKQKMDVPQPSIFNESNHGIGGVDVFDRMRGQYRIRIRSEKWYRPQVVFGINASLVNARTLYR